MSAARPFYVTTPIYYVNDEPHVGHAYTTILADVFARHHRIHGGAAHFLTGTDEHGQKVQEAAQKRGLTPLEHCDELVERFRALWVRLQISNDDFIRTTESRHETVVAEFLIELQTRGEIYRERYEGLYCIPDERFWTAKDVVDGNCPLCGRPVVTLTEENYFFRMSRHQEWLVDYIKTHPEFIQPKTRRNEVLGFLEKPLGDLCISRPAARLHWGIPIPFDPEYVTYVWVDALVNYVSAVRGTDLWPASMHLIGKDILTTHCVYWPTLLHALGLPMPETILAHGWWLQGESKMSKSVGNVVKPLGLVDLYGVDAFRYYLLRDMVVGQDAEFSEKNLVQRLNSDLANDLGNCLNRVERMIGTYAEGRAPEVRGEDDADRDLAETGRRTVIASQEAMLARRPHEAIEATLQLVRATNRYLELKAPWKAFKTDGAAGVATTLWTSAEALRLAAVLLAPVIPAKSGEMLYRLGVAESPDVWFPQPIVDDEGGAKPPANETAEGALAATWGALPTGTEIRPGTALFPRVETEATEATE